MEKVSERVDIDKHNSTTNGHYSTTDIPQPTKQQLQPTDTPDNQNRRLTTTDSQQPTGRK
jgi:hypothetical protein